jgi:hypothetical protein
MLFSGMTPGSSRHLWWSAVEQRDRCADYHSDKRCGQRQPSRGSPAIQKPRPAALQSWCQTADTGPGRRFRRQHRDQQRNETARHARGA